MEIIIGNKIKQLRKTYARTQENMAQALGVTSQAISRWENGDVENMRREKISKLADALKIDPLVILGRKQVDLSKLNAEQTASELIKMLDTEDIELIMQIKKTDDE